VVNDLVALKRRKYNTAHTVHGTPEEQAAIEAQAETYRRAKAASLSIANVRRLSSFAAGCCSASTGCPRTS
jgi:hypothetical protein